MLLLLDCELSNCDFVTVSKARQKISYIDGVYFRCASETADTVQFEKSSLGKLAWKMNNSKFLPVFFKMFQSDSYIKPCSQLAASGPIPDQMDIIISFQDMKDFNLFSFLLITHLIILVILLQVVPLRHLMFQRIRQTVMSHC